MSDIHFECPKCNQSLEVPEELANQLTSCPTCNETIEVPFRSKSPPPQILPPSQPPPKLQSSNFNIGDIGVTSAQIITPNGSGILAGSQWIFMDTSRTETKIPAVAIILAIVFALLCLIGLLFLLMKEKTTTGYVEVTVRSGNFYHKTQIPVNSQMKIDEIRQLVSKAQALAMQAA